eukprot:TRINITY_DN1069_c2_g1_i1.p1 TRINITY_DN1069_c2_g1~~TRINITY_DN1069_c2_g1_i1.p1  ORF type:complete len:234 (+),score=11.99 TRINITY_DN1069_c2_g1_i1:401-1102(+)
MEEEEIDCTPPAGDVMEKRGVLQEFFTLSKEWKDEDIKKELEWKEIEETDEWGDGWLKIIRWLNFIIRKPQNQKGRFKHLYVHGKTRLGKTTRFIEPLMKRLCCYIISKDEVQNMPWRDGAYDLCILDEFDGQKQVVWMNEFLGAKNMLPFHRVLKLPFFLLFLNPCSFFINYYCEGTILVQIPQTSTLHKNDPTGTHLGRPFSVDRSPLNLETAMAYTQLLQLDKVVIVRFP